MVVRQNIGVAVLELVFGGLGALAGNRVAGLHALVLFSKGKISVGAHLLDDASQIGHGYFVTLNGAKLVC